MARLPFNPDLIDVPQEDQPMSVGDLARQIKQVVANGMPSKVRVAGEISNFSDRSHWFFSLKDEQASMRCVCFASSARKVGFDVRDGMAVVATGRVDYYEAQGQIQLYVDKIEPVGQGALEMRFRALCEELRKLGYFDPDHKKPLPAMATRIAVVTSRKAAALQDVINTATRRWPGCQLYLVDVRVQGEQAAGEIAAAINKLSGQGGRLGIDAILITRGGGSIEDLWAFNERTVADALFKCTLPTVAAIGHETDTTIAELVADMRCATPTQAAMQLVPDRSSLAHQVDQIGSRMSLILRRRVDNARQRLESAARSRFIRKPSTMLDPVVERLGRLAQRMHDAAARRLDADSRAVGALARQLEAVGPGNVLQRGYTYTLGPGGRLLRQKAEAASGDVLTTHFADGEIRSIVEGDAAPRSQAPPAKRKSGGKSTDSPGLFG